MNRLPLDRHDINYQDEYKRSIYELKSNFLTQFDWLLEVIFMLMRSVYLFSLSLALAACGGGGGGGGGQTAALDVTAPKITSAALDESGQNIVLNFDEALASTTAPSAAFKVSAGTTSVPVGGVSITGSAVTLKLASTIQRGQAVLLSYTAPDANAAATNAAVQDMVGNDASSIINYSVTVPVAPVAKNPLILIAGVAPTLNAAGEYIMSSGETLTITDTEGRLSNVMASTQNSAGEKASTAINFSTLTGKKYEASFSNTPSGGLTTLTFGSFAPVLVIKLRWK
jgi:uncharacterized repeat protein (TIGR02059 family)